MYDGVIEKPSLDELYHHGITGMKWGVKNGPPYPLSSKISTGKSLRNGGIGSITKKHLTNKALKKAEKLNKKKNLKSSQQLTTLQDQQRRTHLQNVQTQNQIHQQQFMDFQQHINTLLTTHAFSPISITGSDKKKNGEGGNFAYNFNKIYSKLPITTMSLAALNIVMKKFALSDSQKVEYLKNKEKHKTLKELQKGTTKDPETGFKLKKNQKATQEEDMNAVNFHRGERFKTTKTYVNCAYCTTAYDLRRRGFEVHAPTTSIGVFNSTILSWYKDAKKGEFKVPKDYSSEDGKSTASIVKKELTKQPNGARGNICVRWKFGGAHSMAYEIQNKKLVIYDCQSNKKYSGKDLDELLSRTTLDPAREPMYIRTDNLTPDYKKLKKKGVVE